jgi:NADPH-dependent curcumin reductase CurA
MENISWIVERAATNAYDPRCLRLEHAPIPKVPDNRVLVRTELLSLDPTSRNWLKLNPAMQYVPFGVGDPMLGAAIGVIVESRVAGYQPGQRVAGLWGWQRYAVADPVFCQVIPDDASIPLEAYLTIFSHIGRAAAKGLIDVAGVRGQDTVLVSGAAGATGSIAAAIAKAYGCRTIGVAGGAEKCRFLADELHLDAVVDYRQGGLVEAVQRACPQGVDVYFDNVGGELLDAVLLNMAIGCRIAVCGMISQYEYSADIAAHGVRNLQMLIFRQARIEGYVATFTPDRQKEIDAILLRLYRDGRLPHRAHVIDGLANAPEALRLLFEGRNNGKLMVRVDD